jgi:cytochrome oxidase Cu insertion factor (SCO1/SenC/PrrC family)
MPSRAAWPRALRRRGGSVRTNNRAVREGWRLAAILLAALWATIAPAAQGPAAGGAQGNAQANAWMEAPPTSTGIAVGQKIPAFSLPDQDGKQQTFDSIKGPKGAAIYFNRSVDW